MDWFLAIFVVQFLFELGGGVDVFSIASVSVASGSISSSAYCGLNRVIENYNDEDLAPFKSAESILKEAVAGDLIEFKKLLFNHWAIYIGDGRVADPSVLDEIQIDEIFGTTRAMVLFVNLTEIADGGYCRVNNKVQSAENRGFKSRSTEEIMKSVKKSRNKGFDYNILYSNCEHKVTEWKFGFAFSDQADAVIGFVDETRKKIEDVFTCLCDTSLVVLNPSFMAIHKILENFVDEDVGQFLKPQLVIQEVKLYDIIEIMRSGYSHYAIYVGNGYVLHLSHEYNIFKTVFETRNGRILREKLIDVTAKDLCRVNNKKQSAKRRGLVPRQPQEIKRYVDALENTKVDYSMYSYNCEHIVTQLKFGKAFSDQVYALEEIAKQTSKIASVLILHAFAGQTFDMHF